MPLHKYHPDQKKLSLIIFIWYNFWQNSGSMIRIFSLYCEFTLNCENIDISFEVDKAHFTITFSDEFMSISECQLANVILEVETFFRSSSEYQAK